MSENILNFKNFLCAAVGVAGGAVSVLFGGWSEDMTTLLVLMSIDFITGLIVAAVFKKSSKTTDGALHSKAGFEGLCKKCVMLLFILLAHRLDTVLGVNYIRTVTTIGFIANETISVTENAGIMGIPMPDAVKRAIELLRSREGE